MGQLEIEYEDWVTEFHLGKYRDCRLCSDDDRRQLAQLRAEGAKRPQDVTYGDWYGSIRFTPRMKMMCRMLVDGRPLRQIAAEFKITSDRLSRYILSTSQCRKYVAELINERAIRFNEVLCRPT